MNSAFGVIQLVVAAAAGVLVFVVAAEVLRRHGVFSCPRLVAVCVAVLSALALLSPGPSSTSRTLLLPESESRPLIDLILVPYAALGLTLLVLLLLAMLMWLHRGVRRWAGGLVRPKRELRARDRHSAEASRVELRGRAHGSGERLARADRLNRLDEE